MFYKRLVISLIIIVLGIVLSSCKNIYKKDYIEYKLLDDGTYEVSNYIWNDKEKKIEVPEEYKGKKVTSIGEFAFCKSEFIKKNSGLFNDKSEKSGKLDEKRCIADEIELPNSIIHIKRYAFSGCNLLNIKIPNNVEKIEQNAFYDCRFLKKVELNQKLKEIEECAFSTCKSLKEIKLPSTVMKLGEASFAGCELLEKVETDKGIPNVPSNMLFVIVKN